METRGSDGVEVNGIAPKSVATLSVVVADRATPMTSKNPEGRRRTGPILRVPLALALVGWASHTDAPIKVAQYIRAWHSRVIAGGTSAPDKANFNLKNIGLLRVCLRRLLLRACFVSLRGGPPPLLAQFILERQQKPENEEVDNAEDKGNIVESKPNSSACSAPDRMDSAVGVSGTH